MPGWTNELRLGWEKNDCDKCMYLSEWLRLRTGRNHTTSPAILSSRVHFTSGRISSVEGYVCRGESPHQVCVPGGAWKDCTYELMRNGAMFADDWRAGLTCCWSFHFDCSFFQDLGNLSQKTTDAGRVVNQGDWSWRHFLPLLARYFCGSIPSCCFCRCCFSLSLCMHCKTTNYQASSQNLLDINTLSQNRGYYCYAAQDHALHMRERKHAQHKQDDHTNCCLWNRVGGSLLPSDQQLNKTYQAGGGDMQYYYPPAPMPTLTGTKVSSTTLIPRIQIFLCSSRLWPISLCAQKHSSSRAKKPHTNRNIMLAQTVLSWHPNMRGHTFTYRTCKFIEPWYWCKVIKSFLNYAARHPLPRGHTPADLLGWCISAHVILNIRTCVWNIFMIYCLCVQEASTSIGSGTSEQ